MTAPDLAGRVAVVTGGARNIGKAIALALARSGAAVAINARQAAADAEAVASEIRDAGGRAMVALADVGSPASAASRSSITSSGARSSPRRSTARISAPMLRCRTSLRPAAGPSSILAGSPRILEPAGVPTSSPPRQAWPV
jgi:hypothetical protein